MRKAGEGRRCARGGYTTFLLPTTERPGTAKDAPTQAEIKKKRHKRHKKPPFRCGPVRASSVSRFASLESPSKCPFSTKQTDCYVVSRKGFGERAQTGNRDVRVTPGFGL